jgi:hypothetical protein
VGPAIKSCIEKVATAMLGETRSTEKTAVLLSRESGDFEKKTFTG